MSEYLINIGDSWINPRDVSYITNNGKNIVYIHFKNKSDSLKINFIEDEDLNICDEMNIIAEQINKVLNM